jgi:hypothetical protein
MCAALPPLRCPNSSHVPLPHLPRRSPASRWLPLASPRRPPPARAALRRCSLSQHFLCHLLPSYAARVIPQLCRRTPDPVLACSCGLHVAELLPELRRGCHVRRRGASTCLSTSTASSGPRAPSLAFLVHVLSFAYFFSLPISLLRSSSTARSPPPSLLTVDSPHHHFPHPIRSTNSIPPSH